jgi:hypothetical protein
VYQKKDGENEKIEDDERGFLLPKGVDVSGKEDRSRVSIEQHGDLA